MMIAVIVRVCIDKTLMHGAWSHYHSMDSHQTPINRSSVRPGVDYSVRQPSFVSRYSSEPKKQ